MRAFILALFTLILAAPVAAQTPSFTISDTLVAEANGKVYVPILKTGNNGKSSKLSYTTIDGTAKSTSDYTRRFGTITIPATSATGRVQVPITIDDKAEGDETFYVRIRALNNATVTDDTATVTITDSTPPVVTPPPPPPPPVNYQTCWDGSVIPVAQHCPVQPPPTPETPENPPPPSFTPTPTTPSLVVNPPTLDFNPAEGIVASSIPGTAGPDVLGAFRFICKADAVSFPWMLSYNDPVVFAGDPGKGHLHQFYGNTTPNIGMANYQLLRTEGGSTCQQIGDQLSKALNRSAYWQAAMVEKATNSVVQPDFLSIYYKRRPATDPVVSNPANPQYQGQAKSLPPGLRFVFGFDPTGLTTTRTGAVHFNCQGPTSIPGSYSDLTNVTTWCPKGQGNQLGWVIEAPDCWNGSQLDSADHRSHVAYSSYGDWGYLKCPATHPFVIAAFTLGAWYSVEAGDSPETWDFSCAMLAPTKPRGYCGHADWFGAWDATEQARWEQNVDGCINGLKNCSGGLNGDGTQLVGASVPIYNGSSTWKNPRHKVPVPPAPPGAMAP